MMRKCLLFAIVLFSSPAFSQLLYPESYTIILDTTRHYKGSIAPSFEIKTPKETYIAINNTADLAYRFKNYGIILANKFELTKNGSETILSGGFVYLKLKRFFDAPWVLEHYGQYQWADARGLQQKYAVGSNVRYKIYKKPMGGAFVGIGPFYEHEEWNYDGVPDERLPTDLRMITTDLIKLNFYISAKQTLSEKLKLEGAFYYQDAFENLFEAYRIGASAGVSYQITKHIAFGVQYRMLFDDQPIVPVDKIWYNTYTELQVTF